MRKIMAICILAMLMVLPLAAKTTGKADAQACGLYDAVQSNYSLFGGIDEAQIEYGFRMDCPTSSAHPAKWSAEGAMLVYGVIYVKLPAGVPASEVVVTKETERSFRTVSSYVLSESILMIIPSDAHDELTIIRPGSKWAGLKLSHVHTHEDEAEEEDDILSGIKWEVVE